MAESFLRNPNAFGDNRTWATYLDRAIQNAEGVITSYLYDDSGTLKAKAGIIGINDGTNRGTITITADKTIDISSCSVSNWCKIEVSVSGTSVTFAASDISGATDPAALHATFKNAWRGDRGGFYISATKKTVGIAWRNASGTLEGIVNCLPFIDGWVGYCQSNDGDDIPYIFEKHIEANKQQEGERVFNEKVNFNKEVTFNEKAILTGGTKVINTTFAATDPTGNNIFDAFVDLIPETDDKKLVSGSLIVSSDEFYLFTHIHRVNSTTMNLWYNKADGATVTTNALVITDGSATVYTGKCIISSFN